MSTITTNPRSPVAPSAPPFSPAEERGVVRGVSWDFYDRLTDAIGERIVRQDRAFLMGLQVPKELWRFGDDAVFISRATRWQR